MQLTATATCLALALGLALAAGAAPLPGGAHGVRIGADRAGGSRFQGHMAAVRIWSRALTPREVAHLAARAPGASARGAGLRAEWLTGGSAAAARGTLRAATLHGSLPAEEVDGARALRFGAGHLEAPAGKALDLGEAVTLEAWVRPAENGSGGGRILDRITPGGSDGWLLDTHPGASLRVIVGPRSLSFAGPLPAARWSHVAAVRTADRRLQLYLGGVQVAGDTGAPAEHAGPRYTGSSRAPGSPLVLWYRRPASRWTEALPLGNGSLGAMVWGGVPEERIQLNLDTLWSGEPTDTMPPEAAKYVPEVRRLVLEGRNREAHDLTAARLLGPYFQSYLPLGDLVLEVDAHQQVQDYQRSLDLATGIARVTYRADGCSYTRETFVSHPGQVLVTRLTCSRPGALNVRASLASQLRFTVVAEGDTVTMSGRAPRHLDAYGGGAALYEEAPGGRGMRFQARVRLLRDGGTVETAGNTLRVTGATSVTAVLAAATSYNGFDRSPSADGIDPARACETHVAAASAAGFEQARDAHTADHRSLFSRVALDLGQGPNAAMPTDERVAQYAQERDPGLAALYYQFGRYLLVAGSRPGTQPLNLQGIWNDRLVPPWASNWTLNCNAQINYWPAEQANLAECHLPLVDLAEGIAVDGARVARRMYGAGGWMTHHNADLWRRATPVAGDPLWAIFQTGGAWLCRHAYEHYAYSGDATYLRRIWPLMKGAATYFLDTMAAEPRHGWLVDLPATNFESYFVKPTGESAAVCMGPTADMQMIRALFRDCIDAARRLGVDAEFAQRLEEALARLAPMQVSPRTGQLQEWLDDWDHASPGNGQILSLWGLVCDNQVSPRRTPELARALRKSLDDRKPWNMSVGSWTGAFASNAFARLGDGDNAAMVLDKHLGIVVNPNLTASFDGMAEWEIDGNLGQAAAIGQMLLQSHDGELDLLPALPKAWATGRVSGLRAHGGIEVSMAWREGALQWVTLVSRTGGTVRVRTGALTADVRVPPGTQIALDGRLLPLR